MLYNIISIPRNLYGHWENNHNILHENVTKDFVDEYFLKYNEDYDKAVEMGFDAPDVNEHSFMSVQDYNTALEEFDNYYA